MYAKQRTQSRRQIWETSIGNKYGKEIGDKYKDSPRVGDKYGRHVSAHAPPGVQSVGDKLGASGNQIKPAQDIESGREAWKKRIGKKCKLTRPKAGRDN